MRHIYVNGKAPKEIYRATATGEYKRVKNAWRAISPSEYVLVWSPNEEEYLRVDSYYIGQQFLESYTAIKVYAYAYWVHYVDGEMVETSLRNSNFDSWECETLEASYDFYGSKVDYVDHYILPTGDKFGQHNMKITYTSPDTGKLLEVEYPIYYLEEISWDWDSYEYDWYPFRLPFAYNNLCDSHLTYQCYDNDGNLIQQTRTTDTSCPYVAYQYPTVDNAQFKIGEGQQFGATYISSYTYKTYEHTISVNIRHYQDERNTATISRDDSYKTTYYYKDFRPTKITYKFVADRLYVGSGFRCDGYLKSKDYDNHYSNIMSSNNEYVNIWKKNNMLNASKDFQASVYAHSEEADDPSYYDYKTINSTKTKTRYFFEFYKNDEDLYSVLDSYGYMVQNTTYKVNLNNILKGTSSQIYNSIGKEGTGAYIENTATCGFAYWGDGTLSYVCLSDSVVTSSYTNAKDTVTSAKFGTLLLKNGTKLSSSGNSLEQNYGNAVFDNTHTYANSGTYDVEFTNFFGYESNDDKVLFTAHNVVSSQRISQTTSTVDGSYYYETISNSYEEDSWFDVLNGTTDDTPTSTSLNLIASHIYGEYDILPPLDKTGKTNIIAFDFGDTCSWGYGAQEYWMSQVNFLPGYMLITRDCKSVTMPRITRTDSKATKPMSAVKGQRLGTVYYDGPVSDFYSSDGTINDDFREWVVGRTIAKISPVGYNASGDKTSLCEYITITIQCNDGSLVV